MPTYRVDVQPDVLIWARKAIGLSIEDAAARLRVNTIQLMYWEEGADELAQPTLVQLRAMARLYRVPLAALYFDSPPVIVSDKLPDFRTNRKSEEQKWSLALHDTYRRAIMQQQVSRDLASERNEPAEPISLSWAPTLTLEATASIIREWLELSLGDQLSWSDRYEALRAWVSAVEHKGILVAQSQGIDVSEMRGFSISDQPFPIIVLNGKDTPRARIFSLIHELVHVLLNESALCSISLTSRSRRGKYGTEWYCNEIAAAVLLPYGAMQEEFEIFGASGEVKWPDEILRQLSSKYHVSREVILGRFVTLGRASMEYFLSKVEEYARQYASQKEQKKNSTGGPEWAVQVLARLGRRYTSDVIQAFDQRIIDAAELTDYLDAKVETVPRLIALLQDER